MNKIKYWWSNARPISLPQSLLPAVLAVSCALIPGKDILTWDFLSNQTYFGGNHLSGQFVWWLALIAVVGVVFAHLGMNLVDDYFDWKEKCHEKRAQVISQGFRTMTLKYPYLTSGTSTVRDLLKAIAVFLFIALVCGACIFYFRGIAILGITLVAALLGVSYSGWPFRFSFHGYGELIIGLMFGFLLMIGVQYSACGVLDYKILVLGIAVGLLVTNIVYSHSVLDIKADQEMGKNTFAKLMGPAKNQKLASLVFTFLPFLLVVMSVIMGICHYAYLSVLLCLPIGIYLFKSLSLHIDGKELGQVKIRWWMGPMSYYEKSKKIGLDWFLLRWLLARNLVSFFALILIVINLILYIIVC